MGLILFDIIGRKVDGHVSANGERVEKHLFSALTSSRKRAELIERRDIQLRPSSHVECCTEVVRADLLEKEKAEKAKKTEK